VRRYGNRLSAPKHNGELTRLLFVLHRTLLSCGLLRQETTEHSRTFQSPSPHQTSRVLIVELSCISKGKGLLKYDCPVGYKPSALQGWSYKEQFTPPPQLKQSSLSSYSADERLVMRWRMVKFVIVSDGFNHTRPTWRRCNYLVGGSARWSCFLRGDYGPVYSSRRPKYSVPSQSVTPDWHAPRRPVIAEVRRI
jgi:hypothetical protein